MFQFKLNGIAGDILGWAVVTVTLVALIIGLWYICLLVWEQVVNLWAKSKQIKQTTMNKRKTAEEIVNEVPAEINLRPLLNHEGRDWPEKHYYDKSVVLGMIREGMRQERDAALEWAAEGKIINSLALFSENLATIGKQHILSGKTHPDLEIK